jgi:hypothetical protein
MFMSMSASVVTRLRKASGRRTVMIQYRVRRTPKPRWDNTVVCQKCHAEYSKNAKWVRGRYSNGPEDTSTPNFIPSMLVPQGHCPVCLTKEDGDG